MQEERFSICRKCGIFNVSKETCNEFLYINPKNNDISTQQKDGYIKGCGCYIPTKIKRESNHCPANKW